MSQAKRPKSAMAPYVCHWRLSNSHPLQLAHWAVQRSTRGQRGRWHRRRVSGCAFSYQLRAAGRSGGACRSANRRPGLSRGIGAPGGNLSFQPCAAARSGGSCRTASSTPRLTIASVLPAAAAFSLPTAGGEHPGGSTWSRTDTELRRLASRYHRRPPLSTMRAARKVGGLHQVASNVPRPPPPPPSFTSGVQAGLHPGQCSLQFRRIQLR